MSERHVATAWARLRADLRHPMVVDEWHGHPLMMPGRRRLFRRGSVAEEVTGGVSDLRPCNRSTLRPATNRRWLSALVVVGRPRTAHRRPSAHKRLMQVGPSAATKIGAARSHGYEPSFHGAGCDTCQHGPPAWGQHGHDRCACWVHDPADSMCGLGGICVSLRPTKRLGLDAIAPAGDNASLRRHSLRFVPRRGCRSAPARPDFTRHRPTPHSANHPHRGPGRTAGAPDQHLGAARAPHHA